MKEFKVSATQRPLLSPEQLVAENVFVATLRLANAFGANFDALFKEHGLTSAQYNTLRVLRDAGHEGLSCQEIAGALIQRDPDVTRLADRLEERGLVIKSRGKTDRRVVMVSITEKGVQLVNELDWPVVLRHVEGMTVLSQAEKNQLLELLQKLLRSYEPSHLACSLPKGL